MRAREKAFVELSWTALVVAEIPSQHGSCPLLCLSLKDPMQWGRSFALFPKGVKSLRALGLFLA